MIPVAHEIALMVVGTLGILTGAGLGQFAITYGTRSWPIHIVQALVLVLGSTVGFIIGLNGLFPSGYGGYSFMGGVTLMLVAVFVVTELAKRIAHRVRSNG